MQESPLNGSLVIPYVRKWMEEKYDSELVSELLAAIETVEKDLQKEMEATKTSR